MMEKFRRALTQCVSEIDAIIGSDGGVSGGHLLTTLQHRVNELQPADTESGDISVPILEIGQYVPHKSCSKLYSSLTILDEETEEQAFIFVE